MHKQPWQSCFEPIHGAQSLIYFLGNLIFVSKIMICTNLCDFL